MDMTDVEVWVLVTEDGGGGYEVAKEAGDLQPEPGVASRYIRLAVKVPTPKPVELVATVAAEPAAGELTAV